MALPPLAAVQDLADRAGSPIEGAAAIAQAGAVLSTASALVRSYTGQSWVGTDGILGDVPDAAMRVTVDIAFRVWTNPDGLVGDSIDDASRRWSERSGDGFYLTTGNRLMLDGLRTARRGIWTLGTTRGDTTVGDTIYVPTAPEPSGLPFPLYSADDDPLSMP